ncbi:MAG: oligosaccharide flippase family protein, partial [Gemmatimonadetes bacterium]|nr:oligosaccharide flippase family protein [Gemmatimonadota bacterium]
RGEIDDLVSSLIVGLAVALAVQAVLALTDEWIAKTLLGSSELATTVRHAGWVIPLAASGILIFSYLRGSRRVTFFVLLVSLETVSWLAVAGWLFLTGAGLSEMLLGLLLIKAVVVIVALFFLLRGRLAMPSFSSVAPYLRHGLPLLPLGILMAVINASDRYILSYYQGTEAAGIYSVSYGLGSIVGLVFAPVFFVLIPATAASWKRKRPDEVHEYLGFAYKYPLIVSIPLLFFLTAYSQSLISILATSEFHSTWLLVAAVGAGIAVMNLGAIAQTILILEDKSAKILMVSVIAAVVNLAGNFAVVPHYGVQGAALVTLATYALQAWIIHTMTYRILSFPWQWLLVGKLLVSAIPLAIASTLVLESSVSGFGAASAMGLALVIYVVLLLVQGGIKRREWRFAVNVINISRSANSEGPS